MNTSDGPDNFTLAPQLRSMALSTSAKVIVTIQVTVMILIVCGNLLVICAYHKFRHLQTVSGKFILNLAVADCLLGLTLPFQISFFLSGKLEKIEAFCLLRYLTIIFTSTSSLMSLLCTVFDRSIAILLPLRYHMIMSDVMAYILILFVWMYAFILASLPLFGLNSWNGQVLCVYELVMKEWYRVTVAIHFIALSGVMFVCYMRIYYVARKHYRQINSEMPSVNGRSMTQDAKLAQVMGIVMLSFTLCWLPFCIIQLMQVMEFSTQKVVAASFAVFLGIINSATNPFIYAWKNKQYRIAFRKVLCCFTQHSEVNELTMPTVASVSVQGDTALNSQQTLAALASVLHQGDSIP